MMPITPPLNTKAHNHNESHKNIILVYLFYIFTYLFYIHKYFDTPNGGPRFQSPPTLGHKHTWRSIVLLHIIITNTNLQNY